jgi:hypothetical protein
MRLADADVMTQADGTIPPLEVRLDLQPGDRVGLYEEVSHPSMGAGYSPIEAVVLGSPEPGWFVGETEDGQEITFHAGNVADVMMASPHMGGIFDWFKRLAPPPPGAMVPSQQPSSQLPAERAPNPEERKGLIAQLKTLFVAPFESKSQELTPGAEKGSIFDIFKVAPGKAGLPAQRESGEVTRYEKKSGMFSFLNPGTKVVIPFAEKAASMVLPEGPGPLAPYIEKALAPFVIIPKSPEPEPYEVRKAKQVELFSGMFPEVEVSAADMFKMFPKEEIQSYQEVIPPDIPERLQRKLKALPMPRRTTLFPSVNDIARGFIGMYNPIDELWDDIRRVQTTEKWKAYIEKYGFAKEHYETLGNCGGPPSMFQELSAFLHIPWEEFRNRAILIEEAEYERWAPDEQQEKIWEELVFPSVELLTEALEFIKPPDIPGHFTMEKDKGHGCMLLFTYTEGDEKLGAFEEWKKVKETQRKVEDQDAISPEQVVAKMKEDQIDPQEALASAENSIFDAIAERDRLDKRSENYQAEYDALTEGIEYLRAIVREILEDLSEEPEEAKPAKKKVGKRTGKKRK